MKPGSPTLFSENALAGLWQAIPSLEHNALKILHEIELL